MLGYLIPVLFLVVGYFAIRHFTRARANGLPVLSAKTAKVLYIVLAGVALLLVLSALGVCGTVTDRTGLDPLLNR